MKRFWRRTNSYLRIYTRFSNCINEFLTSVSCRINIHSIRAKIFGLSILSIVLPLIAVGVISTMVISFVLKSKISETNQQMAVQVRESLDFLMEDMEKSTDIILSNKDVQDILKDSNLTKDSLTRYKSKNILEGLVRNYLSSRPEILYFNLSTKGFELNLTYSIDNYSFDRVNFYDIDGGALYRDISVKDKDYFWKDELYFLKSDLLENCIFLIKKILDQKNQKELGILAIGINKKALVADLQQTGSTDSGNLLLISAKQKPVFILSEPFGGHYSMIFNDRDIMRNIMGENNEKSIEYKLEGMNYLVSYSYSTYSGWNVISVLPMDNVIKSTKAIKVLTVQIVGVCMLLALLCAIPLSNQITRPVKQLTRLTSQVQDGNFDVGFDECTYKRNSKFNRVAQILIFGNSASFKLKLLRYFLTINILPILLLITISYYTSVSIIEREISKSMMESLDFINKRLELNIKSAEQFSRYLLTNRVIQSALLDSGEAGIQKLLNIKKSLEGVLLKEISRKENLNYVGLFTVDGGNFYSSTNVYYDKNGITGENFFKIVEKTKGENIWVDTYKDNLNNYVISTCRKIFSVLNDNGTVGRHIGYLLVGYNEGFLEGSYRNINLGSREDFFIINDEGIVLSNKNKGLLGTRIDHSITSGISERRGNFIGTINNQKYMVLYTSAAIDRWKLIGVIPLSNLIDSNKNIFWYNLYILLISFFISIVMAWGLQQGCQDL